MLINNELEIFLTNQDEINEVEAISSRRRQEFWEIFERKKLEEIVENINLRDSRQLFDTVISFVSKYKKYQDFFEKEVTTISENTYYNGSLIGYQTNIGAGISIINHPRFVANLFLIKSKPFQHYKEASKGHLDNRSIAFPGHESAIHVLDGDAEITIWEYKKFDENKSDKINEELFCKLQVSKKIAQGDTIFIGTNEKVTFDSVEKKTVIIQIESEQNSSSCAMEFNAESKELMQLSSATQRLSRYQMFASFINASGRNDGIPILKEFLDSKHHFIRWSFMREILGMEINSVYPELKVMAEKDPHNEVRKAASMTLRMINEMKAED